MKKIEAEINDKTTPGETRIFHCERCGDTIKTFIRIVRAKNAYDVCELCCQEIEDFIKTKPDHGVEGLTSEQKVQLADSILDAKARFG